MYLSKGHCWSILISSTGKCWCSSCIRRGGTFALQHDIVSVQSVRLWFLLTSKKKKKNEMEPNWSSSTPESAHTEKETLSTAALQWMRCSGPAQLFLVSIILRLLQVFSQTVTPFHETKPACHFYEHITIKRCGIFVFSNIDLSHCNTLYNEIVEVKRCLTMVKILDKIYTFLFIVIFILIWSISFKLKSWCCPCMESQFMCQLPTISWILNNHHHFYT